MELTIHNHSEVIFKELFQCILGTALNNDHLSKHMVIHQQR